VLLHVNVRYTVYEIVSTNVHVVTVVHADPALSVSTDMLFLSADMSACWFDYPFI